MNDTKLLEMVQQARKALEPQLQMAKLIAEIRWHSYNAHIEAGFSAKDALILCANPLSGPQGGGE